jgi:hypothetical protein
MNNSFESKLSLPLDSNLSHIVRKGRFNFLAGSADQKLIDYTFKIFEAAKPIIARVCQENSRTGVILGVSKNIKDFPVYMAEFGKILFSDPEYLGGKKDKYYDYSAGKARVLQLNPSFIFSQQNMDLSPELRARTIISNQDIPGGAVADGGNIVSISGVSSDPKVDQNTVLEIIEAAHSL